MTGRDLIIYIMKYHLEDEPIFKDGKLIGFVTADEFAEKWDVGSETVRLWVTLGYVDGFILGDTLLIPCNAEIKETTSVKFERMR